MQWCCEGEVARRLRHRRRSLPDLGSRVSHGAAFARTAWQCEPAGLLLGGRKGRAGRAACPSSMHMCSRRPAEPRTSPRKFGCRVPSRLQCSGAGGANRTPLEERLWAAHQGGARGTIQYGRSTARGARAARPLPASHQQPSVMHPGAVWGLPGIAGRRGRVQRAGQAAAGARRPRRAPYAAQPCAKRHTTLAAGGSCRGLWDEGTRSGWLIWGRACTRACMRRGPAHACNATVAACMRGGGRRPCKPQTQSPCTGTDSERPPAPGCGPCRCAGRPIWLAPGGGAPAPAARRQPLTGPPKPARLCTALLRTPGQAQVRSGVAPPHPPNPKR